MPRSIPGLSQAEAHDFREAMKAPGAETRRRVTVMDLDHNPLRRLTDDVRGGLLAGQVRWNTKGDVHTEATVSFSDFDDSIDLDLRHLVRIEFGVIVSGDVLWCPLITGWVRACNDTGHEAEVLLHDKSAFGLQSSERGKGHRGEYVGAVIRRMHARIGETHFNIPESLLEGGPRLASPVHWGGGLPEKSVTRMSRRLAKRAGLQVFYDQMGRLTVRRPPQEPTVSWVEPSKDDVLADVDARLLEPIHWARDYSGIRTKVVGRGARDLTSTAKVADGYIFSPEKLVRGGEPVHLTHRYTDDTIDRLDELEDATRSMLRRMSTDRAEVQITSTPAPWLVAQDLLHAAKRDGRATDFWMGEGAIELDGSAMTIGYTRPMRRPSRVRVSGSGSTPKQWKAMQAAKEKQREARHHGK